MKYEDFVAKFPKSTKTTSGVSVICPAHKDRTPSLSVSRSQDGGILLKCFAGCATADVVAAMGLKMADLFASEPTRNFVVPTQQSHAEATAKPTIDKIYSYQNSHGDEVYQVLRMRPKTFRQRHRECGDWVWNMENVERVLYHLPEVLTSSQVWIVEGEKDADTLMSLGFIATCNVGGAGKWLEGYTETLAGKEIVICGDNDKPGEEHAQMVFDSICGKAKNVRLIRLPSSVKDVSDYVKTFSKSEQAKEALETLFQSAHPFINGTKLPIYTMAELENGYKRMVNSLAENSFNLGKWLPTLGRHIRPVLCGELVFIIGDTGTGKTGVLSEIARAALPLPTLFFEMELPPELMFERTLAAGVGFDCQQIEHGYRSGDALREILDTKFKNLFICTESKLTLQEIENYIVKSELKIGERPKLVLVDYIQLIGGYGQNRREKVSDIAEGLKILAKTTRTIIICASQIRRPDGDEEVSLHSAKESGSIENSCGVLLGAWRDGKDSTLLHVRVLKSTKGGAGTTIECNFDGKKMRITERSKISEQDLPMNT